MLMSFTWWLLLLSGAIHSDGNPFAESLGRFPFFSQFDRRHTAHATANGSIRLSFRSSTGIRNEDQFVCMNMIWKYICPKSFHSIDTSTHNNILLCRVQTWNNFHLIVRLELLCRLLLFQPTRLLLWCFHLFFFCVVVSLWPVWFALYAVHAHSTRIHVSGAHVHTVTDIECFCTCTHAHKRTSATFAVL